MNLRTALTGLILLHGSSSMAGELLAAVAKVEITDHQAGPVTDPCFAKVLLLKKEATTLALITVDAVAIGEIGRIGNGFLQTVRTELQRDLGIEPSAVIINASHCHGIVRGDAAQLVIGLSCCNLIELAVVRKHGHNLAHTITVARCCPLRDCWGCVDYLVDC
jgi:hypothetical protein